MPRFSKKIDFAIMIISAIVVLGLVAWSRPLPQVRPDFYVQKTTPASGTPNLAWPNGAQAAIGAEGYGLLTSSGPARPVPTASVAKTITALAVLKQKPLQLGQQGPMITITAEDQAIFDSYYSEDGSVVAVTPGEQLSERQALEAMMLPSANNMADTLARWAFGSISAYASYANQFVGGLGIKDTHISDASGFSPSTTSTAADLVRIGQLAVQDPVLSSIISEQQADIPVAGTVHNVNWLLGVDGINGIKTGNTDQAGGVFLYSALRMIDNRQVTLIGAVMGAPTLEEAMTDSRALLASTPAGFSITDLAAKDQAVGRYQLPWGKTVPITTTAAVSLLDWTPKSPVLNLSASTASTLKTGQIVGTYYASSGIDKTSVKLQAAKDSGSPPWLWRLFTRYF